jgi:hypothetical protein
MLADMAVGIEAGRMLTYKAATEIDAGRNNTMFASMAKVRAKQSLGGEVPLDLTMPTMHCTHSVFPTWLRATARCLVQGSQVSSAC